MDLNAHKASLSKNGFTILDRVYSDEVIQVLVNLVEKADQARPEFRKSADLFAIRRFLKIVPEAKALVFNEDLKEVISGVLGNNVHVVKSIYFDKPERSNWFVPYHQDLMISVEERKAVAGYGPWTQKLDQCSVQPPQAILETIYTMRIHLDDTDENNGALRVIPRSHIKGIYRAEAIDRSREREEVCRVQKGGIMLMRPLLLHSSGRSIASDKRRVIHIEFSSSELPEGLKWSEHSEIYSTFV